MNLRIHVAIFIVFFAVHSVSSSINSASSVAKVRMPSLLSIVSHILGLNRRLLLTMFIQLSNFHPSLSLFIDSTIKRSSLFKKKWSVFFLTLLLISKSLAKLFVFVSGPVDDINTVWMLPWAFQEIWHLMFKSRHSLTLTHPKGFFSIFLWLLEKKEEKRRQISNVLVCYSDSDWNNTALSEIGWKFALVDLGRTHASYSPTREKSR